MEDEPEKSTPLFDGGSLCVVRLFMKRFKNILYLNESSVDQTSALERAVSLAQNNQANLTVVDVIPPPPFPAGIGLFPGELPIDVQSGTEESARRTMLESMLGPYSEHLKIRIEVLVGRVYLEAIGAVLKNGYDLLIKAAENPSWTDRLFGSDDLHLLRKCPCPVWLIRLPEKPLYRTIVAAVDFDLYIPNPAEQELNREVLSLAASLALSDFASLHIVHAWEAPGKKSRTSRGGVSSSGLTNYVEREYERHKGEFHRLLEQLRGWMGDEGYAYLSPSFHLPQGAATKAIPEVAATLRADIVVMGTVARTGISGLFIGNTAETILDQLTCSVLAIKPPGFVTPVHVER